MFRPMRRSKQELSREECVAALEGNTSGTLAVTGDGGYPYAVPLSYVYRDGKLYFHSAVTGHKVDAIERDGRASFCVIDRDSVFPAEFTTYYRSVIAFGKARIIRDENERRSAAMMLAAKYSPGFEKAGRAETEREIARFVIIELTIEHMTGKEAIELVRARKPE